MQFTELSELNRVIGMMRMSSCNSPTFHDRQDSEVDRIYNSSPKMEMQLRNSWMDRMAAVKAPNPSVKKSTQSNAPTTNRMSKVSTVITNGAATAARARTSSASTKSTNPSDLNTKTTDEKSATTNGGDGKVTENKGNATANGDESSTTKTSSVAGKEKDDGFEFVREEVGSCSTHEISLLDKLLKGGASTAVGQKPVMMGTEGGTILHLTIYLPSRQEMKIGLYDSSTVDESIQEILRTHQSQGKQPTLYYGHPECYELRLHDSDGYPDEDFPALDRSRKIKNFGDAGGHEYCLCERPDACPPSGDPSSDALNPVLPKTESVSTMHKALPTGNEKIFLKIYMPKSDDYTVVAVDNNTTGQDLLPTLNKKHRLQLFQDQYVLKISEAERERLDLASDEIDMHTKLRPLNIHEATLATKQYADAPQVPVTVTNTIEDTTNVDSRSRPPPETFMFNDVTVAMYKEWHVIKKNKFGKKQHRMLGIDMNKVYNRKVGERVIKSRNTTKIAERPISSVEWVRFMQDPSDFQIYFKDSIEEIITDYTADSPYECAEIVAKLKYILFRRKQ